MHCVSKCFVSNRSFRIYSLLLLGMVFGFSLSTIIQALGLGDTLRTSAQMNLRQPLGHHETRLSNKIAFSNLHARREVGEEELEFGDYGYEREMEPSHRRSGVREEEHVPAREQHKSENLPPPSSVPPLAGGVKTRYRSDSWQGRNMMEANSAGLPPDRLTEEIPTRQTLLVVVVTSVTQLMTQTLAIQGTWAPQATQVVYFIGEVDQMPHLPHGMDVVELEGVDDEMGTWELKEISAIKFLIDHYLEQIEWFLIVSDETYVVTENLEGRLNRLDARLPVYMGQPGDLSSNGKSLLCKRNPGIVYSRTLLEELRPYLPMCWPGGQGEGNSLVGCLGAMGVKCTQAKEVSVHNKYWYSHLLYLQVNFYV